MTESSQPDVSGEAKILIVDDYPANVKLLERNLQAVGYDTVPAYDGEEALEKVESEKPDLILLDIMLPKIDGFEVCERLRGDETTAVIPIIMITALKETEDRIHGLEVGADDFISKPFDRGELLARVKSLLQIKYYRSMLAEREKFHAVIQDLSHGIIITDRAWRIQIISRKAAQLLGHADEDLAGWTLAEAVEGFKVEPSLDALKKSDARTVTIEFAREFADRPSRYLAGRYTRITGRQGQFLNAALVFRDITEMRRKEKLKRDFLSLVSHKLKTPLTIVSGYLDLIDKGKYGEVPDGVTEAVRISIGKVEELQELIEKLLTYAGLTATELERAGQLIVPRELAERIRERVSRRHPARHIEIVKDMPDDLPRVRAPEELVSIVLDNLLDNAVKFTPQDPVRVEVGAERIEDQWLRVRVTDSGPGIPYDQQEQIFQDFLQLEDEFTGKTPGIGLGLSTAKRLVESWGGEIDVESEPGEGATFTFTVPSEESPAVNGEA